MKDDIRSLMDLQAIDLQMQALDRQIVLGHGDIEQRTAKIEARKNAIAEYTEKLAAGEKRKRQLDAEVEDELVRIKDRQTKLMNVQTNREYQSLLKEVEDGKLANKQREDELLLILDQSESLKKKTEEESNLVTAEETLLVEEREKVAQTVGELSRQKEEIEKSREGKAKKVNASYLRKYEMLRERRDGLAVTPVTNGVCRGCNMNIPPQLFNDLLRDDKILSCPTCNRIMFHQPASE